MSENEGKSPEPSGGWARLGTDQATLTTVALCLFIAAAAWLLLKEFAALLRPLLLAVLLCYVILPTHRHLRQRMPGVAAIGVMAVTSVLVLVLLGLLVYSSAVQLRDDLPGWIKRIQDTFAQIQGTIKERLPWLAEGADRAGRVEEQGTNQLRDAVAVNLVSYAKDVLTESIVVGVYLLFLLLEVRRMPDRVRYAFANERAEHILAVAVNINEAMASYLKVKVKASLVLAVPVTIVLLALDVKFAVMWGVITFIANFVPYLGSVVACSLPILLAFLQLDFGWRPITAAAGLIGIHMASAYLIEPRMIGKSVGLSPLVILLSLAFWGLCWGLIGMVLAVPLTVMLKIVLENVAFTRPVARMMGE